MPLRLRPSKALIDFVIRCSAFGLFATSLNLLVGYTGMVSFGHGMFFGLGAYGFGLIMQTHRHARSRSPSSWHWR